MLLYDGEALHNFVDKSIRKLAQDYRNLRDLIMEANPAIAKRLDFEKAQFVPTTFLSEDWRGRESDLIFTVSFLTENQPPILICLLLEHQSAPDVRMSLRLLIYMVMYWERAWWTWEHNHQPREPLHLTPILPVLFHTGTDPWKTYRELSELIHGPVEMLESIPRWKTLFLDLADYTPEELLQRGSAWLQALAVVRAEKEDFPTFQSVFQRVLQQLEGISEDEKMRWHDLLWFVFSWMLWRRPKEEQETLIETARASQSSAAHQKEVITMTETAKLMWEQEFLNEVAQIRKETEAKVKEAEAQIIKAEIRSFQDTLKMLLNDRFGELSPEVLQEIESTTDLERLKAGIRQTARLQYIADFRL